MTDEIKHNLQYFECDSMQGLYTCMDNWQKKNQKRLLSTSIQKDNDKFCCIALTNPTEVVITDKSGREYVDVVSNQLRVYA